MHPKLHMMRIIITATLPVVILIMWLSSLPNMFRVCFSHAFAVDGHYARRDWEITSLGGSIHVGRRILVLRDLTLAAKNREELPIGKSQRLFEYGGIEGGSLRHLPASVLRLPSGYTKSYIATPKGHDDGMYIQIPYWLLFVLVSIPAGVRFNRWRGHMRRRSMLARDLCPSCGYDLRASPERCPECGLAIVRPASMHRIGPQITSRSE